MLDVAAQGTKHPRKTLYRSRAHSNPLSDMRNTGAPVCPSDFDWCAPSTVH